MPDKQKPEPKNPDDPRVIHLSKPIRCHGETHKKLMLPEEVTVKYLDSLTINLVSFNGNLGLKIQLSELKETVAVLTDITETAVGEMAPGDFIKVAQKVIAFLGLGDLVTQG